MTDIKHTPGPWFTEHYGDGTIQICGDLVNVGEDEQSYTTIVEALTPCDAEEANARLIVAAPDLLAALEDALHGVEGNHPLDADIHSWQDAARSAIARARGEA